MKQIKKVTLVAPGIAEVVYEEIVLVKKERAEEILTQANLRLNNLAEFDAVSASTHNHIAGFFESQKQLHTNRKTEAETILAEFNKES